MRKVIKVSSQQTIFLPQIIQKFHKIISEAYIDEDPVKFACDLPAFVPNSYWYSTGYTEGDTAEFTCHPGYIHGDGTKTRSLICNKDFDWIPGAVNCQPKECLDPPMFPNAVVSGAGRRVGQSFLFALSTI